VVATPKAKTQHQNPEKNTENPAVIDHHRGEKLRNIPNLYKLLKY